ncbi:Transposon TX1 uncharacterized 149 kDa protein [Vitis vinifera]|nr:Transposon TX1 uncharacterized 149 kDa protein [Vitis vinifera]
MSQKLWLKEDDKNSQFFHKMANAQRRRNYLTAIKVNGRRLTKEDEVKEEVVNSFQRVLSKIDEWRLSISGLPFPVLDSEEARAPKNPFSEEEILAAPFSLCGDKVSGLDEFSMAFWQFCWDIVKFEVMGLFVEFHHSGLFERSLNPTFIVLIPKKGRAQDLRDFWPISLVGSLYKLLAKVSANRLKRVVGRVVSNSQHAFMEGRQILDAILTANEALDSRLKSSKKGVICKLDIEKAYDHVNWEFLLAIMEKMGLGAKWVRQMRWCISFAHFLILINETPIGFFVSSRGLRQMDPLSPFLFILAIEVFSNILKKALEGGFIQGFLASERGGMGTTMSHLLLANDTLIFSDSSKELKN